MQSTHFLTRGLYFSTVLAAQLEYYKLIVADDHPISTTAKFDLKKCIVTNGSTANCNNLLGHILEQAGMKLDWGER